MKIIVRPLELEGRGRGIVMGSDTLISFKVLYIESVTIYRSKQYLIQKFYDSWHVITDLQYNCLEKRKKFLKWYSILKSSLYHLKILNSFKWFSPYNVT